jgi:hypothetical protein
MSKRSIRRFCVRFYASNCYKVTVAAKSAKRAIAKAQKLWQSGSVESFTPYAGDTDAWDAEPE